ncbi:pseudouridine synthase [Nonomuraea sp. LPB2021202275-12-8]|uniref:pseudouridine synthase n=1 Tax=Nonomuraea sp. LPB2021202275-12-8 TaxID=3120159 RepID=UPI00300CAA31
MINRRSTPSGDGRGRGRAGGSSRGGRPAFRSDDTRGATRRDDFRDGPRRDDRGGSHRDDVRGPRRDDSRSDDRGGFRRDDRAGRDDSRGGFRRDDSRGGSPRDGGRDGARGGYRGASGRDDHRGGPRRDDSDRGYGRDSRSEAGPARDSLRADRGGARARYGKSPGRDSRERTGFDGGRSERRYDNRSEGREGYGSASRGDRDDFRPAPRGDREGYRPASRDGARPAGGDREGFRSSRGGDRESYRPGGRDGSARRNERGGFRDRRPDSGAPGGDRRGADPRGGAADGERGGYGADRRGYSSDQRGERGERGGYSGDQRGERGGRGHSDGGVREDRGGFRADRSGRREGASEGGATRARFGRRDEGRGGGRASGRDDGRGGRTPRRDGVQTIGGGPRAGYGGSRGGQDQPPRDRFKTARQPMRDRDLFPEGYTDERDTTEVPGGVRLQKVLAQAGVASRRACEEMIGDGRVTVNGQVVRRFGAKVDPATQIIHVDGKRIPTAPDLVYYALNKPIGVVSTMDDPQGRPCLADFVEELAPRLFHVGRLDTETEGLLLLTNDGELANRLTHPSYGVQKKYWAKVPGPIPRDLGRRLKQGIELEDGLARADSFAIVQEHGQQALVEVVLHEGRKHVVRRMLEEAGHRVIDLARIEFGPVKLGRTKPGTIRSLSLKEVGELYAAVKL